MDDLSAASVADACLTLRRGGVVGYPSETVWGLAALPEFLPALYRRKGRDAGKPVQASCADAASALALARPHPALDALSAWWPGPLSVVAPAAATCPPALAPGGWVGLRVPAQPLAQALLRECGPLATTSLNPAGAPPAATYAQAQAYALADLLLGGPQDVAGGLASTVLGLPDGGGPARLMRVGAVSAEALRGVLAPLGLLLDDPAAP